MWVMSKVADSDIQFDLRVDYRNEHAVGCGIDSEDLLEQLQCHKFTPKCYN